MEREIGFYNHLLCSPPFSVWSYIFKEKGFDVTASPRACLCELGGEDISKLPNIVVVSPCCPWPSYEKLFEHIRRDVDYCWKRIRLEIERKPYKSFFVEVYPGEYFAGLQEKVDGLDKKIKEAIGEHPNLCYFDTLGFMDIKFCDTIYRASNSKLDKEMKKILASHNKPIYGIIEEFEEKGEGVCIRCQE